VHGGPGLFRGLLHLSGAIAGISERWQVFEYLGAGAAPEFDGRGSRTGE